MVTYDHFVAAYIMKEPTRFRVYGVWFRAYGLFPSEIQLGKHINPGHMNVDIGMAEGATAMAEWGHWSGRCKLGI